jgi:ubiquinone/menaquinone biosynthesis C-methylase UbiE
VGTGRFAGPLGIEVGVEPARAMAEIASTRGLGVIQGYAEAPPFADGSFDFVLMVTVLCFLKDPVQALGEATRVLKAQGRLIVGMIDPESPLGKLYEANQAKSKFYRNARFHPVSQGLVWLRDLGYENVMTCQTLYQDTSDIAKPDPVKKAMEREVL